MDMRLCFYCGGDGKDETYWDDKCIFCDGTGFIESRPQDDPTRDPNGGFDDEYEDYAHTHL